MRHFPCTVTPILDINAQMSMMSLNGLRFSEEPQKSKFQIKDKYRQKSIQWLQGVKGAGLKKAYCFWRCDLKCKYYVKVLYIRNEYG